MNETAQAYERPVGSLEATGDYENLLAVFRPHRRVLVAFSGGVDSALVLQAARDALGPGAVVAVTAASPAVPARELRAARDIAAGLGVSFRVVRTREGKSENYARNHHDRCFYCKSELYTRLAEVARRTNCELTVNGTNADDLDDVRPGLEAARLMGVRAPLVEAGIDKAAVRRLARSLQLSVWDKPAAPCLASRVPYFTRVEPQVLKRIERAEDVLIRQGFREMRVRHHGDLARIEVPPAEFEKLTSPEIRRRLVEGFRECGYRHVTLDLAGLQSGGFNRS